MIHDFERIQQSYEKQCEDIMNYVEMIDHLRTVVYKNIRELTGPSTFQPVNEHMSPPVFVPVRHERIQQTEATGNNPQRQQSSGEEESEENSNKTFMNKIHGTTKKTIQHAEEGLNKLDGVIKQLRTHMQKK
jgi:archaellum component FlaC